MKRGIIFLCVLCFLFWGNNARAQTYPDPEGFVNDFAHVFSHDTKTQLEEELSAYEKETTHEISVVTINSLEGVSIEEYAVTLFEKWGIGKKEHDNGVLFLVAVTDRKMRIEVGYGLEGVLTDAKTKIILDQSVKPFLSVDNFEEGIVEGTHQIMSVGRGEELAATEQKTDDSRGIFSSLLASFFSIFGGVFQFLVLLLIIYALSRRNRRGGPPFIIGGGGGGFGGGSSGGFGGFGGGSSGGGGSSSDF